MSEFILHDPFLEVHGKFSKKNGRVTYMVRRDTGKMYTAIRKQLTAAEKQERQKNISAEEKAAQEKFARVVKATRTRLADETKSAADLAAFTAQSKYPTIYGFVFADEYAKDTE